MKELNQILKNEIAKHLKNLKIQGDNYAKDLKSHSQKMKRAKNIANKIIFVDSTSAYLSLYNYNELFKLTN